MTHELVVGAALELIDERGFRDFSIRTLASRLGVTPRAVRYRIGSRDELLVAVADRILRSVQIPSTSDIEWADWLRLMASSIRTALLRHPKAVPLVVDVLNASPGAVPIAASIFEVMLRANAHPIGAVHAYNTFVAFILGFAGAEATAGGERLSATVQAAPTEDAMRNLDGPVSRSVLDAVEQLPQGFGVHQPVVSSIEFGFVSALDVVIAGIAATNEPSPADRGASYTEGGRT